jgi:hypothetical protein
MEQSFGIMDVIHVLRKWANSDTFVSTPDRMNHIYSFLARAYYQISQTDAALFETVRTFLLHERWIYWPEVDNSSEEHAAIFPAAPVKTFFSLKEVCMTDYMAVMAPFGGWLVLDPDRDDPRRRKYPTLHEMLMQLGVHAYPPFQTYVDLLSRMCAQVQKKQAVYMHVLPYVVKIMEWWSRGLQAGRIPPEEQQEWAMSLPQAPIWPTLRGQFVALSKSHVFVPDNADLTEKFCESGGVDFFFPHDAPRPEAAIADFPTWVRSVSNLLPQRKKLRHLVEFLNFPLLSLCVVQTTITDGCLAPCPQLQTSLSDMLPYLQRYLSCKHTSLYHTFANDHVIVTNLLSTLKCWQATDRVKVCCFLN